jgi:hypothetical protein
MCFISIGSACNVKSQIDKYTGGSETLFFDWLMTDMDSVISVLNSDNIDKILNINNIVRDEKNPIHGKNSRILIKSLSCCVSIHDIGIDVTRNSIIEFINKYKRRYNRIIEFIKSDKKLYFIRYGKVDDNTKNLFIKTVLKINPNCNFFLISINICQSENTIIKNNHFLELNITTKPPINCNDWTTSYLNWVNIFKDIENNTC